MKVGEGGEGGGESYEAATQMDGRGDAGADSYGLVWKHSL
jgi:hypothetical protein